MFVRWQQYKSVLRKGEHYGQQDRIGAVLVESVRVDGKPRHRHVAFLGSLITWRPDHHYYGWNGGIIVRFWQRLSERLDKLHNRITLQEREMIVAALSKRIGPPPDDAAIEKAEREAAAVWEKLSASHGPFRTL
jgi:hypothetical protein